MERGGGSSWKERERGREEGRGKESVEIYVIFLLILPFRDLPGTNEQNHSLLWGRQVSCHPQGVCSGRGSWRYVKNKYNKTIMTR